MSPTAFRFVHASDLHLDVPFQGLCRASPAVTQVLSEAPLAAWDALVQLAIDHQAAFLLLAGDICDGAERAVRAQLRFLGGLQRLSEHGIRTFIVRGDDDPAERWTGIHQWPDGVECFGCDNVRSVAVSMAGERVATIYGISHSADHATQNRVPHFRRGSEPGIHIGLLHARVGSPDSVVPWDSRSVDDLQAAGMDYWALGHDHRHQRLSAGHPWMVYPGTLQGRSLNCDETGPKGAVVVDVANGVVRDAKFHALDSVRLMTVETDLSTLAGPPVLRRALLESAIRLRHEHTGHNLIVRAILRGRGEAHTDVQRIEGLWEPLLEELRKEDVGVDTFVWWDSVLDITEATVDRETIRNQNDISAQLLALVDTLRRAPETLDRFLADQVAPHAGPGVPPGQPALDSAEVEELLTRAERLALNLLENEQ